MQVFDASSAAAVAGILTSYRELSVKRFAPRFLAGAGAFVGLRFTPQCPAGQGEESASSSPLQGKTMITTTEELVTPEYAKMLLEKNAGNRPVKRSQIEYLCNQLTSGFWQLTGAPIIIASTGRLIDGQHRLMAVIKTGIPIRTMVTRGVEEDAFVALGGDAPRGGSDVLAIAGYKEGNVLAAAARYCLSYAEGTGKPNGRKMANQIILKWVQDNPEIIDSLPFGRMGERTLTPAMAVALHYLASRDYKQQAGTFLTQVQSGLGLEASDPAYLLRTRIRKMGNVVSARVNQTHVFALSIKAFNAFNSGRSVVKLGYDPEREPFPSIK